nr:hypothetical protein HmN_001000800 [Hymenolepis microstoma]
MSTGYHLSQKCHTFENERGQNILAKLGLKKGDKSELDESVHVLTVGVLLTQTKGVAQEALKGVVVNGEEVGEEWWKLSSSLEGDDGAERSSGFDSESSTTCLSRTSVADCWPYVSNGRKAYGDESLSRFESGSLFELFSDDVIDDDEFHLPEARVAR